MSSTRGIKSRGTLGDYLILVVLSVVALLPILWGLTSSLKPANELFRLPVQFLPSVPTVRNYVMTFQQGLGRYVLNSFLISGTSVAIVLLFGTIAAYALARFKFRGRRLVISVVLFTMMVPGLGSLIPMYMIMSRLHLVDSFSGLLLAYTALNLPFAVWILRSFFMKLPAELEDAAVIDGCGPFRTFALIMVPLTQPGLAAVSVFAFLNAWNDHLMALTIVSRKVLRTIPVAIYYTLGDHGTDWGILTASAVVSIVPTVLVYLFLQKRFIAGLTAGSVKT